MKNVIISGASRGIGRATAIELASRGYRIAINYNSSEREAKEVLKVILDSGGEAEIYRADVSSMGEVKRMVEDFSNSFGLVWGVVANAGIYLRKNIRVMREDEWRRTLDVNLTGAFNLIKASLEHMEEGSIVLVSSQLAFKGSSSDAAYAASKAGLLGLTHSLALQLAPKIRVNAVAPGTIDTDIISSYTEEDRRKRERSIPLGRIGKPEEVARVIAFLISEESSYVNGATIDVNGGLYMR